MMKRKETGVSMKCEVCACVCERVYEQHQEQYASVKGKGDCCQLRPGSWLAELTPGMAPEQC